jgi:hypothetical protein
MISCQRCIGQIKCEVVHSGHCSRAPWITVISCTDRHFDRADGYNETILEHYNAQQTLPAAFTDGSNSDDRHTSIM